MYLQKMKKSLNSDLIDDFWYNQEHTVQNGRVILDKLPSTFDT